MTLQVVLAIVASVAILPAPADEPVQPEPAAAAAVTEPTAEPGAPPPSAPEAGQTPPASPEGVVPSLAAGPTEADLRSAAKVRDELDAFLADRSAALDTVTARKASLDEEIKSLERVLEDVAPRSDSADTLHETIDHRLTTARQEVRDALDRLKAPSAAPSIESVVSIPARRASAGGDEWKALVDEVRQRRAEAVDVETRYRWARVAVSGDAFHRLSDLRTASFETISDAKRAVIFGTSREGLEQLVQELKHLAVAVRYYALVRGREIREAPAAIATDVLAVGEILIMLLRVALVLAVAFFVRSRWRDWLHDARGPLFRWLRSLAARRRLERVIGLLEIAFPWLLLFVTIEMTEWALGDAFLPFEIRLGMSLLWYYGAYRLSVDLTTAGILRLASRYELELSAERKSLVGASVLVFFRVVFGLVVLSLVSGQMLGGGYLSQLASRFAGLVVAITLLVLMLRWRRELADAFLGKHQTGPMSDLVRRTRDSWLGVFVAPASFLWILGRATAALARDFAMGFEQTRRALAFLFRRKVEKEAERRGYAAGDLGMLPDGCLAAFSEDAVDRGPGVVANFPGMEQLTSDLAGWKERGEKRSLLLTGQRGVGKTSWLGQIRREDLRSDRIVLGERITTREELISRLAERLGCSEPSVDALVRHLDGGERRVVVLDDAQHLFLANVNGYGAWAAFVELINRTGATVFWIVAMSRFAWKHLEAVRADARVFTRHLQLAPWNEEMIRELLRERAKASGLHFNFSSLVLESLEGVSARDRLIESAEGYARLIWDYADGNPRVAIHYFLRSLDPISENRVMVRLFRAPDVAVLESMGDVALFTLACIIEHERISVPHIVEVTRYPYEICRTTLDRLVVEGVVLECDGLCSVTTHWHRAVVRTLRRRNILML